MRLEPQSQFVLARGLEDHQDSNTYYVRAVIRDSKTDQLLDTVNLTDNGNRRFTKQWLVSPDPTGEGRDILITYTVYTDSAYTTKSENYTEKFAEYRIEHIARNSGGGGVDVDYARVKKIVAEELDKLVFPTPDQPEPIDLRPVLNAISRVQDSVSEIDIPTPVPTDLKPVIAKIDGVGQKVERIPEPDFSGVEYRLDGMDARIEEMVALKSDLTAILEKIRKFFGADMDELKERVEGLPQAVAENLKKLPVELQIKQPDQE